MFLLDHVDELGIKLLSPIEVFIAKCYNPIWSIGIKAAL